MTQEQIRAELNGIPAVLIRTVARECQVTPFFRVPGKGPKYHDTATLIGRIADRISSGVLNVDTFKGIVLQTRTKMETAWVKAEADAETAESADGIKTEIEGEATVKEAVTVPEEAKAKGQSIADILGAMIQDIAGKTAGAVNEKRVKELIEEGLEGIKGATRIEVTVQGQEGVKDMGLQHHLFPQLLKYVSLGKYVWLTGPAGSGKTTAAEKCAEALGLKFYFNGALDTEYKVRGFVDAHGKIVSTAFREAYTHGGLYLFDEIDASLPGATLALNAALANGLCDFPGEPEPVRKHKDFRIIAAANTWGYGADAKYVGRNRLDAAFLDRFAVSLPWDYDNKLELALGVNRDWTKEVQRIRKSAFDKGLEVVISPRASIHGGDMIAAGCSMEEVRQVTILNKIGAEARAALGF